jgi:hypothetical protein
MPSNGASQAAEKARRLAQRIEAEVLRAAGKGLDAARWFLVARIKEALSEPAPRRKVPGGGYRATTRATRGAPPRKLSGRGRASVTSVMRSPVEAWVGANARSAKGYPYMRRHERRPGGPPGSGAHPFAQPTAVRYRREIAAIIGRPVAGLGAP